MSAPDAFDEKKDVQKDTKVDNPAYAGSPQKGTEREREEIGNADDAHNSRSRKIKEMRNNLRISSVHRYKESRHYRAAFWSSERKDVPMYFGHQPEGTDCKRFTFLDHAMEVLATIAFVMVLPAVFGFLPFFVPLAGEERECKIPDASLASQLLADQTLPSNATYSNSSTELTFPCAEIRTSTFLFYTCPGW